MIFKQLICIIFTTDYKKIESHNQKQTTAKSVRIAQNNLDNWKPWVKKTSIHEKKSQIMTKFSSVKNLRRSGKDNKIVSLR